jgi:hypothetical protein
MDPSGRQKRVVLFVAGRPCRSAKFINICVMVLWSALNNAGILCMGLRFLLSSLNALWLWGSASPFLCDI